MDPVTVSQDVNSWAALIHQVLQTKTFMCGFFFGCAVVGFIVWTMKKMMTPSSEKILTRSIETCEKKIKDQNKVLELKDRRIYECHKRQTELELEIESLKKQLNSKHNK